MTLYTLPAGFSIHKITKDNQQEAIEVCAQVLNTAARFGKQKIFIKKMYIKMRRTYSIALYHENNIIGGYFFNEDNHLFHEFGIRPSKLSWMEKNINTIKKEKRQMVRNLIRILRKYPGRGIEGVAIFLKPEYRGKGLGKILIHYPYEGLSKDFSYIWGGQEKQLDNLYYWLKRRELLYDTGSCFYTIASIKPNKKNYTGPRI